jgi:predicted nuclease of predicted toxin-antitoxin system
VRFLVDEMFGHDLVVRLEDAGHDTVHVQQLGLAGAEDHDLLARAADDDRVVVTENAADFVPLLEGRTAAGLAVPPVVIALKRGFPPGAAAMHHALAVKLTRWAEQHPDPYRHVHWLS